ncbi:Oidioi.mRNA.OKI2018_I69.XSR.g13752.t1.cds [Oikopleura dioica]|uniref:ATP-dependent RNA helicase n=1 Tax=Oikopleura dioica TaxID=34765 RepID=A0ABN7SDY7_OIKDI|nr:Oidioi.mRNA.OKI2018_I69.XSR.g13752.t1.cds [Oikopleura dioica]
MIRSFSGKRFLNVGNAHFGRSFKYEKPDTQRPIDKAKYEADKARFQTKMPGAMPKRFLRKIHQVRADQSSWDRMDTDEKRAHIEREKDPFQPVVSNFDAYKKQIRSSLRRPLEVVSIPGTDSAPLITCSGTGNASNFNLQSNERYQTFTKIRLFSDTFSSSVTDSTKTRRPEINFNAVESNRSLSSSSFASTELSDDLKNSLANLNFVKMSNIQKEVLETFFNFPEADIVGISETGSGKTLAYILPVLHSWLEKGSTALIITTQNHLALQIRELAEELIQQLGIDPSEVVSLTEVVPIMIRTLHSIDAGTIRRDLLVFDEADEVFSSQNFAKSSQLLSLEGQKILLAPFHFSETQWPLVRESLGNRINLETDLANRIPLHIPQKFRRLKPEERSLDIIKRLKSGKRTIIYVNRYKEAVFVERLLKMYEDDGFQTIRKGMNSREVRMAIDDFESGKISVLIGTDKISRGIDFSALEQIINFCPPYSAADYLNRIGRTGRLGQSFVSSVITYAVDSKERENLQRVKLIEEAVRRHSKISELDPNFNFDQHAKIVQERKYTAKS